MEQGDRSVRSCECVKERKKEMEGSIHLNIEGELLTQRECTNIGD